MKNYIKNLLKASLVMLAVVAAFAFTTPSVQQDYTGNYGRTVDGQWIEITDQMELGEDYVCSLTEDPDLHCIYDAVEGNIHPDFAIENSVFELLP